MLTITKAELDVLIRAAIAREVATIGDAVAAKVQHELMLATGRMPDVVPASDPSLDPAIARAHRRARRVR